MTLTALGNFGEWVLGQIFASSDLPGEYKVTVFWRTVNSIHTYVLPNENAVNDRFLRRVSTTSSS